MNSHLYPTISRILFILIKTHKPGLVIPATLGKRRMWREVQNLYTASINVWVGSILAVDHNNHKN